MICDTCGTREAKFLLGDLETGDQTAFCTPDFLRFGLDAAKAGLEPDEILGVLGIEAAGVKVDGKAVRAKAAKRTPEAEPATQPEPEPEPVTGPPEVAAAAADE